MIKKQPIKTHSRFHLKEKDFKLKLPRCGPKQKVSYSSKSMAEKFRQIAINSYQQKLEIYKCNLCKNFHLTSQKKRKA